MQYKLTEEQKAQLNDEAHLNLSGYPVILSVEGNVIHLVTVHLSFEGPWVRANEDQEHLTQLEFTLNAANDHLLPNLANSSLNEGWSLSLFESSVSDQVINMANGAQRSQSWYPTQMSSLTEVERIAVQRLGHEIPLWERQEKVHPGVHQEAQEDFFSMVQELRELSKLNDLAVELVAEILIILSNITQGKVSLSDVDKTLLKFSKGLKCYQPSGLKGFVPTKKTWEQVFMDLI